jgi:hypothetical protein
MLDETWKFFFTQGVLGVVLVIGGWISWKVVAYQSAQLLDARKLKNELQEKRVDERDSVVRAVVTNTIAMEKVAAAIEQNNRALEAHTKAIESLRGTIDARWPKS